ncbi:hypothetical protein MUK42_22705 [Musa troglodytarum]|uniref:RRM domain-containing protein n=1 Tax=Musa troglodytarum TaxID=320322 RepID=A0A9E7K5B6_9LILI|nr:hypothetical protein MUK42_22705 [Musa troglodytarum]
MVPCGRRLLSFLPLFFHRSEGGDRGRASRNPSILPLCENMSRDPAKTVYIGNLDEKVSERVLYEILIQVGRVVDLYIPRDKETNRHKGYAFAEYESEEIADYAVRLFSGLVRLHNKTLKFAALVVVTTHGSYRRC